MFFLEADPEEDLNEFAFRALIKAPEAERQLDELVLHAGDVAGRLYGLLGLKLIGSSHYYLVRRCFLNDKGPVRVRKGTAHWQESRVGEVARGIAAGEIR